ncbi:WD40 repeat-like protein [Sistotremastrum suecicum HHB10207 ss-3]|uniref:WD40 repeat-like protein n=1 Tax=Sistotremastrum suecicum HHB10207 ss-3 TaxID=1314776 RepID=A0A166AJH8_9AGAM|nr:WD40 repeat-like protein [Sistotremastrum suecicum HHB10207 ss-3]
MAALSERRQEARAFKQFTRFEMQMTQLDGQLRTLINAARQVDSSVVVLSSALQLRRRLNRVSQLFERNFTELYPRHLKRRPERSRPDLLWKSLNPYGVPKVVNITSSRDPHTDGAQQEQIPGELRMLSKDLVQFLNGLREFPEFIDEGVSTAVMNFHDDLTYWASTLEEFEGQLRSAPLARYIADLMPMIGTHLDALTGALSFFVETGLAAIRQFQSRAVSNLVNFSTVATFFSAITAQTLQISFTEVSTTIGAAVNTFWVASLIFSVAAVVNSLLGLSWSGTLYRSPRHKVPFIVRMWLPGNPLALFLIAVELFFIGLILFVRSSKQSQATIILTTVLAICYSGAILCVIVWVSLERWTFAKYQGLRWLYDVLAVQFEFVTLANDALLDSWNEIAVLFHPIIRFLERQPFRWSQKLSTNSFRPSRRSQPPSQLPPPVTAPITIPKDTDDTKSLPQLSIRIPPSGSIGVRTAPIELESARWDPVQSPVDTPHPPTDNSESPYKDLMSAYTPVTRPPLDARLQWKRAISSIVLQKRQSMNTPRLTALPNSPTFDRDLQRREYFPPFLSIREDSLDDDHLSFQPFKNSISVLANEGLIRSVNFSPDGKYLATASWDRSSRIFRVETHSRFSLEQSRVLTLTGFGRQVLWSSDGTTLLNRLTHSVATWRQDGTLDVMPRPDSVDSLAWMDDGSSFASAEGSKVYVFDLGDREHAREIHDFDRFQLHDIVIAGNTNRMVAVASLTEIKDESTPFQSKSARRILVYHMMKRKIESQIPIMENVTHIAVSKAGDHVLLSCEGSAYPTLWKLHQVHGMMRIQFLRAYCPERDGPWATSPVFAGPDDQFVVGCTKGNDIYVWNRDNGNTLQHIKDQDHPAGRISSLAARTTSSGRTLLAAGYTEGHIRFWTNFESQIAGDDSTDSQPR